MGKTRIRRKGQMKSSRKNRYSLETRHSMGISATARAAAKRALKPKRKTSPQAAITTLH